MAQSHREALGTGGDTAADCGLCLPHRTENLAWPGTQTNRIAENLTTQGLVLCRRRRRRRLDGDACRRRAAVLLSSSRLPYLSLILDPLSGTRYHYPSGKQCFTTFKTKLETHLLHIHLC